MLQRFACDGYDIPGAVSDTAPFVNFGLYPRQTKSTKKCTKGYIEI